MNIHYFQRYHRKEDVATANTMLLLSRLYSYSPTVFYTFLKNLLMFGLLLKDILEMYDIYMMKCFKILK